MGLKSSVTTNVKLQISSFKPTRLETACSNARNLLGSVTCVIPSPFDIKQAYQLAKQEWDETRSLNRLPKKVLRMLPWAFFVYPEEGGEKFGHQNAVLNSYMSWFHGSSDVRSGINLFHVYLRDYPVGTSAFELIKTNLEVLFAESSNKRMERLRIRAEQHGFFDEYGPKQFARKILEGVRSSPKDYYEQANLTGILQFSGFGFHVYLESLKLVKFALRNNANAKHYFDRVCEFSLKSEGVYTFANLTYPDARVQIVEALLEPYAGGSAAPELRDDIREFLLKIFGDIRFEKQRWNGVSEPAKQVMRRWLVSTTLEDFFSVLDKTADKQWRYRKAFWSAYLNHKAIDEAWVVLGSNARMLAKGFMKLGSHGQLLRPYTPDQSVLLLRIDNLIIAEWSHNGSCRVWDLTSDEKLKIPKLYGPIYDSQTLRTMANWSEAHVSAKSGAWQKKVRRHIYNATGINITDKEMMP